MSRKATRTTEPAEEPITTAQAKLHLSIASAVTGWDSWIASAIIAARIKLEEDTDTCAVSSSWKQTYDTFPECIRLYRRPVTSVTSIQYRDSNGTLQTLASSNYRLDTGSVQPRIIWDDQVVFPVTDIQPESVVVTYVAGYANAASVPELIKIALKVAVADAFMHRDGTVQNSASNSSLMCYDNLIRHIARSTYP